MLLTDFEIIRPAYETSQEEGFDWFVDAYVRAEGSMQESFRSAIKEKIWRVGCKPEAIQKRGHVLRDFLHRNWEEMEVYRLHESPSGKGLDTRNRLFAEETQKVFERYYPEGAAAPDDLIHVSCTGYAAPSGAQKIVSKRNWGASTTVTHAYHMGCYGSIPAIRMARGFLAAALEKKRADIVHTEICTLHMNPSIDRTDQLVIQSLFADGFIKYSAVRELQGSCLAVEALREEIIPKSIGAMSWDIGEQGFQMSLGKEVAVLIARHLPSFLERLGDCRNALFAVHPGGPKILTHIQELLGLSDRQMRYSFEILKECGNMSSATLPHIWHRALYDETIPTGTPIVSLAFGPGLTIAGALLVKQCGS